MKRTLSIILSMMLMLLAFPAARIDADTVKSWTVPEGYCEEEYDCVAAFLEHEDENGIKNGDRLNPVYYDPNDPDTWHTPVADELGHYSAGISWSDEADGLKHLYNFNVDTMANDEVLPPLSGTLDLSVCSHLRYINIGGENEYDSVLLPDSVMIFSCQGSHTRTELDLADMGMKNVGTIAVDHNYRLSSIDVSSFDDLLALWVFDCSLTELDVSNNEHLLDLMCDNNDLTSLDLLNNKDLTNLWCHNNRLTDLDLRGAANLRTLQCNDNNLESLDLSHCDSLENLWVFNNPMDEIDLRSCPNYEYLANTKLYGYRQLDLTGCIYYDIDRISSVGNGTIGCFLGFDSHVSYQWMTKKINAFPNAGAEFLGWYDDEGELISTAPELDLLHDPYPQRNYTARFTEAPVTVPEGYCENDFLKIRAFLEQENADGLKNGEQMNPDYDPDDPETWWYEGLYGMPQGVMWTEIDDVKYASTFTTDLWPDENNPLCLAGDLDVSDCTQLTYLSFAFNSLTSLNASNSALRDASLRGNPLSWIDLTGCTELDTLNVMDCPLDELDLRDCTALYSLNCNNCNLNELDLSSCTLLNSLNCVGNPLTELDLSNNPELPYDSITAEGGGTIGFDQRWNENFQQIKFAVAAPSEGESFMGWYNESGELIGEDEQLEWFYDTTEPNVIARFTGGEAPILPGDVNGSGDITVADAIMALRAAMGVLELEHEQFAAADVNESGGIEVADAIIILRMAMGILN